MHDPLPWSVPFDPFSATRRPNSEKVMSRVRASSPVRWSRWNSPATAWSICWKSVCWVAACPEWVTGPLVYLRFHGPTERAYAGGYSRDHLRRWAKRVEAFRQSGRDVYAYFNNDDAGHAVADARTLRALLKAAPVPALAR